MHAGSSEHGVGLASEPINRDFSRICVVNCNARARWNLHFHSTQPIKILQHHPRGIEGLILSILSLLHNIYEGTPAPDKMPKMDTTESVIENKQFFRRQSKSASWPLNGRLSTWNEIVRHTTDKTDYLGDARGFILYILSTLKCIFPIMAGQRQKRSWKWSYFSFEALPHASMESFMESLRMATSTIIYRLQWNSSWLMTINPLDFPDSMSYRPLRFLKTSIFHPSPIISPWIAWSRL